MRWALCGLVRNSVENIGQRADAAVVQPCKLTKTTLVLAATYISRTTATGTIKPRATESWQGPGMCKAFYRNKYAKAPVKGAWSGNVRWPRRVLLPSHAEYAPCALFRLEKRRDRQTGR